MADTRFKVIETRIKGTKIRLLLQPNHVSQAHRYIDAIKGVMGAYQEWIGTYPYPVLSIVDPGPGAGDADEQQYPMLFAAGTTWWMPSRLHLPEYLIVHGVGAQYWHSIVAPDTFQNAWTDEGLTGYVDGLVMDELYGSGRSFLDWLDLRFDVTALQRFVYLAAPALDPVTRPSNLVFDATSYRAVNEGKAPLILKTLERHFGREVLLRSLRDFFSRWRFRHPTGAELRKELRQSLGDETEVFLKEALDGTSVLDYAVARIDVRGFPFVGDSHTREQATNLTPEEKHYRTDVVVEGRGGLKMPVEVSVSFEDRSQTRELWDGREPWRRLEIVSKLRGEHAELDPEHRLPLDVDWLNNSRMRSAGTRGVVRLAGRGGLWLQHALHMLTAF